MVGKARPHNLRLVNRPSFVVPERNEWQALRSSRLDSEDKGKLIFGSAPT